MYIENGVYRLIDMNRHRFRQHLYNNQEYHRVIDAFKYILAYRDNEIKMNENNQFHFHFCQRSSIYRKVLLDY
jgi:hypothetical protein